MITLPDFRRDSALVLDNIRRPMHVTDACKAAGVSYNTFNNWLERGREEYNRRANGDLPNDGEQKYLDLFLDMQTARQANPPESKSGRHSLIFEIKPALLENIRQGMTYKDACDLAGISYRTFRDWAARGENEMARLKAAGGRGKIKRSEVVYVDFVNELKRAKAKGKQALVATVYRAGTRPHIVTETRITTVQTESGERSETVIIQRESPPEAKMALAILERRNKNEWARRNEVTGAGGRDLPATTVQIAQIFPGWENYSSEVRENVMRNLLIANGTGDTAESESDDDMLWDEDELEEEIDV